MRLGAVVLARLAAGLLGSLRRRPLRERGGLALPGSARLIELFLEAFDLGLQFGNAAVPLVTGQANVSVHPC